MAIKVIYALTDDIVEVLNRKAEAFAARHPDLASYVEESRQWSHPETDEWFRVESAIDRIGLKDQKRAAYLRRLWVRILQRATGTRATMIAYGFLAREAD